MTPTRLPTSSHPPECDPGGNLGHQIKPRHVGLAPAIGGDYASVSLGRLVYDRLYSGNIDVSAIADHRAPFRWAEQEMLAQELGISTDNNEIIAG
jgi:hypothetical protein